MGFEPMTSRLSAERANQAVPLAYKKRFNYKLLSITVYLKSYIFFSLFFNEYLCNLSITYLVLIYFILYL